MTLPDDSDLQPVSRGVYANLLSVGFDPRNVTANTITQVKRRAKEALASSGCVKIQVVACRAAAKAAVDSPREVGRKASTPRRGGAMHWARTANLVSRPLLCNKAQQIQNLSHRDASTDFLKADTGHSSLHTAGTLKTTLSIRINRTEKRNP